MQRNSSSFKLDLSIHIDLLYTPRSFMDAVRKEKKRKRNSRLWDDGGGGEPGLENQRGLGPGRDIDG